ncbi:MAG: EamA/RhaT family transporter, partial [Rhodobacteraceae bacterium]|nr:EamA/RhaT family transporter [Paracoccaceae bacterium]
VVGATVIIASGVYIVFREARPGTSGNRPVLETRGRAEVVTAPRSSVLQRILSIRTAGER